jgi:hypothetical protein
MTDDMWVEYDSPGTQTLGHKDVEQAIARLEQVWGEVESQAQVYPDNATDSGRCDACAP